MLDSKLETFLSDAPLFLQPWWLEVVAPGRWDYVVVKRGEEIAAAMPYVFKRRLGWTTIEGPHKTPYLGPWLRKSTAKYANRLAEEKDLLTELIDGLPSCVSFRQAFHPGITNWLPFYWKGFSQTTKYTYRFEDVSDLEAVWKETRENIRTDIKKARKSLLVEESDDFQIVLDLHKLTCERQGFRFGYTDEEMHALHRECKARECCKILVAKDRAGRPHSAGYFLWDASTVYYYTSGADPALRNSGAGSLVVWSGIELASKLKKSFDFEGSMVEPIETFFRAFGARQVPYFWIQKTSISARLLKMIKSVLKTKSLTKNEYNSSSGNLQ